MRIPATLLLVFVAGCGLLGKKGDDAGVDMSTAIDAAAAATPAGAPIGKNAAAVARFATEAAVDEPKMIGQTATPRTQPSGGAVVATLKTGTIVTRIATNAGHSLIVFPDPNVPADNLMGWVTDAAFSAAVVPRPPRPDAGADAGAAPVDAGPPPVVDAGPPGWEPTTCTKEKNVAVKTPTGYACRHVCTDNKECTKGTKKCETVELYNPEPGKTPPPTKACHDDQ
jgi:hypothetical protein